MTKPNCTFPSGLAVYVPSGLPWQDFCPDAKKHHKPPKNMDPTTGLSPTHQQVQCPTCGLYSRWVKRKKRGSSSEESRK
jgi:hypothetical protein